MTELLAELNPQQRQAVETIQGPILVLAGPGSGKTKVLTHRIAYMIQQGIDPWNILAVTFTNKASKEMRHRLDRLVGEKEREVTMGTFHSLCARILRHHAQHVGYDRSFIIYDTDDQRALLKRVMAEMNLSDKTYRPTAVHSAISRAKNDGLAPAQFRPESYWEEVVGRIYERYQEKLQQNNALDFDDLLLLTARLLRETPSVLEAYRRRWQYIHVDEFQDTNLVQYELVRLLAEGHKNVFVVGDMDQCVPAGSLVLTPRGELPIEQIREGDTVISGAGGGETASGLVEHVHVRPYTGLLIEATLKSGRVLSLTPNHMCFARQPELHETSDMFPDARPALKGPGYSSEAPAGLTALAPRGGFAEVARGFSPARVSGIRALLTKIDFISGEPFTFTPAGEFQPGMLVPIWQLDQIVEDEIISVEPVDYRGIVYDLDVAPLHNYIVEGVVVHNSVYGWRGADYRNILKFEETFPEARTIALEQNYRSTQTILDAATALIRRNRQRKDKALWSNLGQGSPITVFEAYDEREEAQYIVREIQRLKRRDGYDNRDFAILYRMNAQSRALEEAFVRSSMKYIIVGGTRFYERREVKDVLAYLRLLHNPADTVSLERIINVPARGIGDKSVDQLVEWARELGMPPFRALEALEKRAGSHEELSPLLPQVPPPFSGRTQAALLGFYRTLQPILQSFDALNLPMLVGEVVQRSGYEAYVRDGTPEGEERWANVIELQNVAAQYEHLETRQALAEFLENVALVSDADSVPDDEFDAVTLMTLHTAKGLEYPVVFIPGLDENVLPHSRAQESPEELEEERRLAYVGVTRAKQQLYLIHTFRRTTWGRSEVSSPSRFLGELPKEVVEISAERSKRPGGEQRPSPERTSRPAERSPRKRRDEEEAPSPWSTRRVEPGKTRPKQGSATTFKAGDRVRHAKFGEGIVLSSTPTGTDEEVTVNFRGDPVPKKLLASFAHLEKVT